MADARKRPTGKRRTSYDFDAKVKNRLEGLKSALLLRGVSGASETAILEALINSTDAEELGELLTKKRR